MRELHDIAPPQLPPTSLFEVGIGLTLVALLLIGAVAIALKRRKRPPVEPSPLAVAHKALAQLTQEAATLPDRDFASTLSLILRTYTSKACGIAALELDESAFTQAVSIRLQAKGIPTEGIKALGSLCEDVKYAQTPLSPEAKSFALAQAETLLTDLNAPHAPTATS